MLGSVGSAAGRLLMPMLSDKIGRRPTDLLLFAVSLGLSAGFAFAQGWWVIACYAGPTFCYSGLAAVLPALSTDLFGLPHAGVNYGFLALGQSVGSLAFPFAANLWGLEAGRHWLAVGGAAAGFAAMWVLKPRPGRHRAGRTQEREICPLDIVDKNLTNEMTKASELTVSSRQLQIVLMFFTGNVLQNPSAFSIIKSCVVVPVKALKESGAPGQMQAAKGSGCAGRARRRLCAGEATFVKRRV